jgi:hypothetical protein
MFVLTFFLFLFLSLCLFDKNEINAVDALSAVELRPTPRTNLVLEPVQKKQRPVTMPPSVSVTAGDEDSAALGLIDQTKDNSAQEVAAGEEIKPNPFPFELPVLRSVSASQLPPPMVRQEPELVLPTLRPVPEKSAEPSDSVAGDVSPAVQWELPPLDSRPNLQALLEREKRAAEAAVNNEALKQRQEEQQRKQQQEELQRKQQQEEQLRKLQQEEQLRKQQQLEQQRKQQEEAQQKVMKQLEQQQHQQQFQHIQMQTRQQQQQQQLQFNQQQVTVTEEMRMAQEAQLAKLSVRLKVQRFESSGPVPINYIGQVSVSQSGSPRQSGMHTPTQHIALTGRNKPTQVFASAPPVTPAVAKPSDVRLVSNTKENSAPVPLPAKSMVTPRMMEQTYHNESTPLLPKTTVTASHIQPPMVIQQQPAPQVLDPFAGVQLRQPAISKFQIELNCFAKYFRFSNFCFIQ